MVVSQSQTLPSVVVSQSQTLPPTHFGGRLEGLGPRLSAVVPYFLSHILRDYLLAEAKDKKQMDYDVSGWTYYTPKVPPVYATVLGLTPGHLLYSVYSSVSYTHLAHITHDTSHTPHTSHIHHLPHILTHYTHHTTRTFQTKGMGQIVACSHAW